MKKNTLPPETFSTVITSDKKHFDLSLGELFRYRDLVLLFVKRDFVSKYKQTALGRHSASPDHFCFHCNIRKSCRAYHFRLRKSRGGSLIPVLHGGNYPLELFFLRCKRHLQYFYR